MDNLFAVSSVGPFEIALRLGLAVLYGLILGLDRDTKNKPIDFRAYMIIAASTCIVALMGLELYAQYAENDAHTVLDLTKIISGALTGIGFLGAGAIIHRGDNQVIGTATGASIWAAGAIGLALGFGFYTLATAAFIAIVAILMIGGQCMSLVNGHEDKEEDPEN